MWRALGVGRPIVRSARSVVGAGGRGEPARKRRIGPSCLPLLGVVCLGGKLRCRRRLQRWSGQRARPAADRNRGHVGGGARGEPARERRIEPRYLPLGVVCLGGQLQRRRLLRRHLRPLSGAAAYRDRGHVGGGGRGEPGSEERRGGTERRSRGPAYPYKKKEPPRGLTPPPAAPPTAAR